jgi:zinc transport system substrate-binding protein
VEGGGHDHAGLDPHVWLDPVRAKAIVAAVAEALAELDPENAAAYRENAATAAASLDALDAEVRARLAPFAAKPFITFHDGYSYFVERYGLRQAGQLVVDHEQRPGAATVRALREAIAAEGIACAFAEPQFDAGALRQIAGDADLRVGVLDALGAEIEPGPALYAALLRNNAAAVETCLDSTS